MVDGDEVAFPFVLFFDRHNYDRAKRAATCACEESFVSVLHEGFRRY
jgi:hypothetical protein